jgi:hypothetical protein
MVVYTNIGKKTLGRDFNFFQKKAISNTTFGTEVDGYKPDMIITVATKYGGVIFNTEGTGTNTVEYSFNGNTVHGELVPGTNRATLYFKNRNISMIWFRVKQGSSGPITVSVEAWE